MFPKNLFIFNEPREDFCLCQEPKVLNDEPTEPGEFTSKMEFIISSIACPMGHAKVLPLKGTSINIFLTEISIVSV